MKRNQWLGIAALLLLLGSIAWQIWRGWGLITVKADGRPLAEVIRSIEKQGGVTIKTDLDLSAPVKMNVEKVNLAEALETLSMVTDSRWRLTYLVAPDKGAIQGALGTFASGQRVEGWKSLSIPAPPLGEEPLVLPDPRTDPWDVKPAPEPKLHAYLQQAATSVSASFIYPKDWNPDVNAPPKSGPIAKSLPKLAKAASAQYEEVFLLQRSGRGPREGGGDENDGPRFASFDGGRGGFDRERGDPDAMEKRIQAEINKLPADKREAARRDHDERRRFFESMRDLTREQREAKMQEFMEDPRNEERIEKSMAAREARRSPEQRAERGQKYRERKQQAASRQQ